MSFQSSAAPNPWKEPTSVISTSTGAYLSNSGVWTDNSSRSLKTNFTPVDSRAILHKVTELPITTWNYKVDDPSVRHIGAIAQDFYQAFSVGDDDQHLTPVDTAGMTMAAIEGLNEEVKKCNAQIDAQEKQLRRVEDRLQEQQKVIDELKKMIASKDAK